MRIRLRKAFSNRNYKVRLLQAANHLMLVPAFYFFSWPWFAVSILMYFMFFCLGVDIGVHRLFSHHAFKTYRPVQYALAFFMTLASIGSTLSWAGMHKKHHIYSDTENDPHTPYFGARPRWGFLRSYLGIWGSYTAEPQYVRVQRRDPMHRIFHYYYFLFIFAYIAVLAPFGWAAVIFGYCVPAVLCFHGASLIVTLGHGAHDKTLPTRDHSQDSVILHWLVWGEGLHNSHHRWPRKYYYGGNPWYFFDLPGFIIKNFLRIEEPAGVTSASLDRRVF